MFSIPDDKYKAVVFDMLFHIQAEVQTMRNVVALEFTKNKSDSERRIFGERYNEELERTKKTIIAQIKSHYSDFNADDYLSKYL